MDGKEYMGPGHVAAEKAKSALPTAAIHATIHHPRDGGRPSGKSSNSSAVASNMAASPIPLSGAQAAYEVAGSGEGRANKE